MRNQDSAVDRSPHHSPLLGLIAFLMACSNPVSPDLTIALQSEQLDQGVLNDPVADVIVVSGEVVIDGELSTGDPCRQLSGNADLSSNLLTVQIVVVRNSNSVCPEQLARFSYRAIVSGLDPGRYITEVVHVYNDGSNWDTGSVTEAVVDIR